MKDLVTIIVPVNNIESYINTCLESILKQTFKNIEVLMVCKNTKDNSLKICYYYEKIDKRFKVVEVKEDSKNNLKNIGIKHASGKYITFVDGGDVASLNYIDYMYKLMKDEKADIVCTKPYVYGSNPFKFKTYETYKGKNIMENYLHMKYRSNSYAKLYKKELLDDIKYPDVNTYDDFMTSYKIFAKADKLVNSHYELYGVVLAKNDLKKSITDYDRMKKIGSCFEMLNYIDDNYPKLSDYCKTKICFEAIDLFKSVDDSEYKKQLFSYIKLYRSYAMKDKRISYNKRVQCARSILGYHAMCFSTMLEKILKK